ncbi:NAD(P)-dependent oxidoreductase [Actinomadura barringtoniae]|uniref:NAD(P)-dependent oxidoreductase n=1 Tax=Actinomadura barringtoniae TaxID=1427535 RepID=A0A939PN11_9ACTN|nr:NAD(P)-dependent oxidoreductase [Actinomadura barringtoniae]MBO2455053.1 NAD(P)-dependent oxidoreductase [Actinomadura barringtoniae]
MILITGGLGFLGTHTARAFLDLGEGCVLTRHRTARVPGFLDGSGAFVEQVDLTDGAAVLELGRRHRITGIVHLAAAGIGSSPIAAVRANTTALLNVLEAAEAWSVPRVSIASTIGVYAGVEGTPFREDMALPTLAVHAIQASKRGAELYASLAADHAGFEVACLRIGGLWGPLGRAESRFLTLPQLVHAAVRGETPGFALPYADDAADLCYVKDCAQAIVLLQTAGKLGHRVYNVSSGRATKNEEVAAAINAAIPGAGISLPEGRDPSGPPEDLYLDTTRLREDTGFEPAYEIERGVADYVAWLRAGNEI